MFFPSTTSISLNGGHLNISRGPTTSTNTLDQCKLPSEGTVDEEYGLIGKKYADNPHYSTSGGSQKVNSDAWTDKCVPDVLLLLALLTLFYSCLNWRWLLITEIIAFGLLSLIQDGLDVERMSDGQ